ncbi:MAG: Asp-tRNA(Asn)/Glu-tRNA(Gln) amidotransferase subunit GatB [Parcubacteria group bacterium]
MPYTPTIGLEIHAELKTKTKMFCNSPNNPDEKHPNVNICPVCTGHPGALPVINKIAIEKLIKVGLALNCNIAEFSKFDRKNYFYPDLPKGYQISQYDLPICEDGYLKLSDGKKIHLERIHMEEDAGKLMHSDDNHSLVDYNRAGVPLMELVTKPEIHSAEDVELFARELQLILRYLDASDANIEKGQMRVEVNVSIKKENDEKLGLGTKVEVKNIGSINAAMRAVKYEIDRQTGVIKAGDTIIQETRGWNDEKDESFSQRTKEGSADYRYFPEPDLPPMRFTKKYIETLRTQLPELPSGRRERFRDQYGLNDAQIEIFTVNKKLGDLYEQVVSEALGWTKADHEKFGKISAMEIHNTAATYMITNSPIIAGTELITAENLAEWILKINIKEISSTAAITILKDMAATGRDPDEIMKEKDLGQISDTLELENFAIKVIEENPEAVEQYKKGKIQSIQFLVGKVMAASKGKADPQVIRELLERKLK